MRLSILQVVRVDSEGKYRVVVRRVLTEDGAQVEIEKLCESKDQVKQAIEDMTAMLPVMDIYPQASLSVASQAQIARPAILPQISSEGVPELPSLSKAPYSYKPGEAAAEILDPRISIWARTPRSVKELQDMLSSLNVQGVSNIANFDSMVRHLVGAGKLKREKIDGVFKYRAVIVNG